MTTVIAIDTSGPVTCIGLHRPNAPSLGVRASGGRNHAEVIDTLMLEAMDHLGAERPDSIAVGVGPGPYSGLRVGISFAIGLGRAWLRPVVGVCSLDAIAWAALDNELKGNPVEEFVVTTDARRDEIYWARYDAAGSRSRGPQVIKRAQADFAGRVIAEREVDAALMATRVARYIDEGCGPQASSDRWAPHGDDGSAVVVPPGPLLAPRPLYLRAPDITASAGTSGRSTSAGAGS